MFTSIHGWFVIILLFTLISLTFLFQCSDLCTYDINLTIPPPPFKSQVVHLFYFRLSLLSKWISKWQNVNRTVLWILVTNGRLFYAPLHRTKENKTCNALSHPTFCNITIHWNIISRTFLSPSYKRTHNGVLVTKSSSMAVTCCILGIAQNQFTSAVSVAPWEITRDSWEFMTSS